MRTGLLAIAGLGFAGTALAEAGRFDGTYAIDPTVQGCVVGEGDVPGAAIRIADGQFFGVESVCRLTDPTNIRDMDAMLFDLQCEGEGTVWSERIMLMKMDDGSLLRVVNGLAFANPPCAD